MLLGAVLGEAEKEKQGSEGSRFVWLTCCWGKSKSVSMHHLPSQGSECWANTGRTRRRQKQELDRSHYGTFNNKQFSRRSEAHGLLQLDS